jgi:hypothetical protein
LPPTKVYRGPNSVAEVAGPPRHLQCILVAGYGWHSYPGTTLSQPVPTGTLQTGEGTPNHIRLKSFGLHLQQSMGHLPSVGGCVLCSFSGLFYCFPVTHLLQTLPAIWSLHPSTFCHVDSCLLPWVTSPTSPDATSSKASHGGQRQSQ